MATAGGHPDDRRKRRRAAIALPLLAALAACASADASHLPAGAGRAGCSEVAATLQSPPGREWRKEQAWRFRSEAEAAAAYARMAGDASPWPDWIQPQPAVLAPGTRFQMAIGGTQTPQMPGAFGTFDNIARVADVRSGLAVKAEWKPQVDRVVVYEVVEPLPVKLGPVGPQVDGASCRLLSGRWSQLEMTVPREERMRHLKVIEVRPIR